MRERERGEGGRGWRRPALPRRRRLRPAQAGGDQNEREGEGFLIEGREKAVEGSRWKKKNPEKRRSGKKKKEKEKDLNN